MEECNTGITIVKTIEECDGNYISTNCIATPNAITYLDLSAGASQTSINAALVSALMRKDEQISEIPTGVTPQNLQKMLTREDFDEFGIYTLTNADNNYSIFINNEDTEETLIVAPSPGLVSGFKVQVLKMGLDNVVVGAEMDIRYKQGHGLSILYRNDWVYIEQYLNTNTYFINGSLELPS